MLTIVWAVRNNLSAHYVQSNNIDLNIFVDGNGWEAIGQVGTPFTGLYNGNNFEIKNLWSGNIASYGGLVRIRNWLFTQYYTV